MELVVLERFEKLPIELDRVREFLRIGGYVSDDRVLEILKTACEIFEAKTSRSVVQKRLLYTHAQVCLHLPKSPINKIHFVKYKNQGSREFTELNRLHYDELRHQEYCCVKIKEEFTTLYMYSKIQVQYDVGYTTETLPASIQEVILNYCLSINDNTHDSIFRNTSSVDNMCSQFRMRFI